MPSSIPFLLRPASDGDWDTVRTLFRAYLEELEFDLDFQGVNAELQNLPGPYARPEGVVYLAVASPRIRTIRGSSPSPSQRPSADPDSSPESGTPRIPAAGSGVEQGPDRPAEASPPPEQVSLSEQVLSEQVAGVVALKPIDVLPRDPVGARICEMKRLYVRPTHRGRGIGHRLALGIVQEARALGYTCMRLDTVASMSAARRIYRDLGFEEVDPYYDNPLEDVVYYERAL